MSMFLKREGKMTSEQKIDFGDVASVEEPAYSASVHGGVTFLSPVQKSKRGTDYFNATLVMPQQVVKMLVSRKLSKPK